MIQAVSDTVIVKIEYAAQSGIIYIPDQAKQHSGGFVGVVESIGPCCPYRQDIKKGDKIHFLRHEGHKIIIGEEEYQCLNPRWILAK